MNKEIKYKEFFFESVGQAPHNCRQQIRLFIEHRPRVTATAVAVSAAAIAIISSGGLIPLAIAGAAVTGSTFICLAINNLRRFLRPTPAVQTPNLTDDPQALRGLQAWCNDKQGTPEYDNRIKAAEKIKACYATKSLNLDLSRLWLTSLPAEIGSLQSLRELNLSDNRIASLPVEIGGLQNLQELDLSFNRIAFLPAEIGGLQSLQELDLSFNRLTLLPAEIGSLQSLRELDLLDNQFASFPAEIGSLQSLQRLDLSGNQLASFHAEIGSLQSLQRLELSDNQIVSLRAEIGSLQSLQKLNLSKNQLTSLPVEIGSLRSLQGLNLIRNRLASLPADIGSLRSLQELFLNGNQLTALPLEIFNLSHRCIIDVTGCLFSPSVLERIHASVSLPDYNGPQISHSINERVTQTTDRDLNELITEVYTFSGKCEQPLDSLRKSAQVENLRPWLGMLAYIADFQKGGEQKANLAGKITEYLEQAEKDAAFRELFFSIIYDASTTCGDRMALSVIHLGIAKQLAVMDIQNMQELANFLIRGVVAIKELEKIAREKILTLPFFDEIEVYLGYLIHLKDRLQLPLDIQEMLYFGCSHLSRDDLDKAYESVSSKLKSFDTQCEFLAMQDLWRKALEKHDPETYNKALEGDNPITDLIALTKQVIAPVE